MTDGVYQPIRCPGVDQATHLNRLAVGVVAPRSAPGAIRGCGSRNVRCADDGLYDCRDCGVYFTESEFRAFVEWSS
jgi:ribosomal protein L37AE/L43A